MTDTPTLSSTARTTLRRHPERALVDRAALHALLDDCLIVHVAVPQNAEEQRAPTLLPMAFGRIGDRLYLHGAIANALLSEAVAQTRVRRGEAPRRRRPAGDRPERSAGSVAEEGGGWGDHSPEVGEADQQSAREVCVCATKVDGLVLAKSAFHHSMNYRAAVIFGSLVRVEGDEASRALDAIVNHALPGRSAECRAPTDAERRATLVVALDLTEASVKVRAGGPRDSEADLALPHWTGVLPIAERMGTPIVGDATAGTVARAQEPPPSVIAAALLRAPRLEGDVSHRGAEESRSFVLRGDPTRLDLPRVLSWLRATYWAGDLDLARLLRSIQASYVVGAYDASGTQVGFARAVTDGETFGWLADVYVEERARGRGIARGMTRFLVEHPRFARLRRWMLGTRDAQGVYGALGFEEVEEGRFWVRTSVRSSP